MSNRLPVLQAAARDAHVAVGGHLRAAADRALEAGAALIEAKGLLPHGGWVPWLTEAGIPARSASRYMTLAEAGIKSATLADLGFNQAERFAIAGRKMMPPDGMAIEARAGDLDSPIGCLALWWSVSDRISYYNIIMPDGVLCRPRRDVEPWVAGLLHDDVRTRFDVYDEKIIPISEALSFVEALGEEPCGVSS